MKKGDYIYGRNKYAYNKLIVGKVEGLYDKGRGIIVRMTEGVTWLLITDLVN